VLASLNHPNIAHIHGLEESNGMRALVMELVEGEDLVQRPAGVQSANATRLPNIEVIVNWFEVLKSRVPNTQ
jgi:hypothetical protein